ncbi:MAG: hypothetical protein IKY49_03430 [Paludibacteraceae bacterium]|nr:hypothetical protein [Paludibacteraceae bacterium]
MALIVSASIDSTTLCIGDQSDMHLRAICDKGEKVIFPQLEKEVIPGVEIISKSDVQSQVLEDGRVQYDQILTVTSFNDSLFYVKPLPFVSNGDTVLSNGISLNVVQPFQLDSTDIAITDIKSVYKAPVWWWGILRWVVLALVIIGLIVGGYFLMLYLQKRNKLRAGVIDNTPAEPARPAHEIALERLDTIRDEMLWTKGQVKEYHTQLTDVVREYIALRFGVSSTEKTSDTTLQEMRPLLVEYIDVYNQLHSMLTLADYVKFAKFIPSTMENEQSLRYAYDFVRLTAVKEETNTTK